MHCQSNAADAREHFPAYPWHRPRESLNPLFVFGLTPPLPPAPAAGGCVTAAPPEIARSSSGESSAVVSVFFSGFGSGLVGLAG